MKKVIRKIFIIKLIFLFLITFQSKVWSEEVNTNNFSKNEYHSNLYENKTYFINIDENSHLELDNTENQLKNSEREFLKFSLGMFLEIIGGIIFYHLGGFISSTISNTISSTTTPNKNKMIDRGGSGIIFVFIGIISAILLGIPLGASLGVYIMGNTENEIHSFLLTFLGSFIGVIMSLVPILLIPAAATPLIFFLLILPTIGAIDGFNLSKQKNKETIINNINISDNVISYKILSF